MPKHKFNSVHPGVVLAEDFLKGLEVAKDDTAGRLDREVEVFKAV